MQVFTDEFHLHTLDVFLKATAQLQPRVDVKQIVIALVDRLAAFAAREAENEDLDSRRRKEDAAAQRLTAKVNAARLSKTRPATTAIPHNNGAQDAFSSPPDIENPDRLKTRQPESPSENDMTSQGDAARTPTNTEEHTGGPSEEDHFRGIPAHVRLFEIFWRQVVDLVEVSLPSFSDGRSKSDTAREKARLDLSPQDVTALVVSLANLAISCYPDRLEYVDQVLEFAADRVATMSTK